MRRDSAEIWQMSWLGLSQAFMHAGRESSHRYSKIAPSVPSVRLCDKGYWWINFSIDYYLSHILWYRSTTDFLIVFCGFCGIFLIILYKFFHWFFLFSWSFIFSHPVVHQCQRELVMAIGGFSNCYDSCFSLNVFEVSFQRHLPLNAQFIQRSL